MALSLGAGVGEEALFRGFLMPFMDGRLQDLGRCSHSSTFQLNLSRF